MYEERSLKKIVTWQNVTTTSAYAKVHLVQIVK